MECTLNSRDKDGNLIADLYYQRIASRDSRPTPGPDDPTPTIFQMSSLEAAMVQLSYDAAANRCGMYGEKGSLGYSAEGSACFIEEAPRFELLLLAPPSELPTPEPGFDFEAYLQAAFEKCGIDDPDLNPLGLP